MGQGRLAFCFLSSFLACHWHLLVCLELFEDAVLPSSSHLYSSVLLMLASFEFRARGARLVSPRGFLCFSPKGLILFGGRWGSTSSALSSSFRSWNLQNTVLDLSVKECVGHPCRPFGRGVRQRGGKAGSLLETSRRLRHINTITI